MRVRRSLQMSAIFTNITHELLTPLTVISASVDKLREEEPEYGHDYDMMQLNIQRMVRLLQQILETSKSEAGELKLLVAQGDVMKYVHETAICIEPLLARKKMKFSVSCQPESMMGWIDTDKLDKIIYNLLSNAAKYAKEGGEVALRAQTNDTYDQIRIEVSDTGEGISPAMMKQLFKRFQDGNYRQHHTIGTGLGLSLTRDLVYLHHGSIHCESEQGKGTTFSVTLPINKEAFGPDEIFERPSTEFTLPKNTIQDIQAITPDVNAEAENDFDDNDSTNKLLIVEDNPELLMLMQQLLKSYYRVYIAPNGVEALKIVQQKTIDLIISDVMMPEMDGYELTRTLKGDPNYDHLPIILLTAKTQEEDEQEALEAGADEFLTKPFRLKDLKLRIDNIIENRKRLLAETVQRSDEEVVEAAKPVSPEDIFLNRVLEHVHAHLEDEDYDRDSLAADMGASASTLYNKLRAITGMSVSAYIRDVRMKEARKMAEQNPKIRVSDLAYSVGFHDPRYFATCFKKQFGMQPKEFLDSLQSKS
jgi:CheY-like chemotaxis protein/anti-sigma regulatory factor (Ser/Thr protein kinase)